MSRLLADTNVLLRIIDRSSARRLAAARTFARLTAADGELCYCSQTAGEFLQVATRSRNGLSLPHAQAFVEFDRLADRMTWLPEPREAYETLRRLYDEGRVRGGANVHDARLAALALHHGLDGVLTFNGRDFARTGLPVVEPGA